MLIDTIGKLENIQSDLMMCATPAVDTETNGLNPWGTKSEAGNRIIGLSIDTGNEAYYFPYRHSQGTNLPMRSMAFFRKYLSNPGRTYRGHNYKFDQHMLLQEKIPYAGTIEDSMLAIHLLNENEPTFKLKSLGDRYIDSGASKDESELLDKLEVVTEKRVARKQLKSLMGLLDPKDVDPYACQDVILTNALLEMAIPALKTWGLYEIWKEANSYSNITTAMENRGILLNTELMGKYNEEASGKSKEAVDRLSELAGGPINPNSPKQVCRLLGIKSSAAEILEVLAETDNEQGRIAKAVMEARGWLSVGSRYYVPYFNAIDKDNVLRTSLNLIGTVSGRLSSSNPNLQAVARQTDIFKVKDIFIARPGYTLVSADYSQAEMRLACYYAKEELMSQRIREGLDIHSTTAEDLAIPRDTAKRINFGVIYGIGKVALARQLHIQENTAAGYLRQYHSLYPNFKKLYRACETMATEEGFIRLWTGRVRRYNSVNSPTHKAMSNIIQGGVAEIMRVSISRLHPIVEDMGGHMLLQIHDQIIFEVPDKVLKMIISVIQKVMCDFDFDPQMKVDVKCGKSWGGMKKWTA